MEFCIFCIISFDRFCLLWIYLFIDANQLKTTNQMKRTLHLVLAVAALTLVACGEAEENNHGLKYDSLDVNFSATKAGSEWSEDDVVGVRAKMCIRDSFHASEF